MRRKSTAGGLEEKEKIHPEAQQGGRKKKGADRLTLRQGAERRKKVSLPTFSARSNVRKGGNQFVLHVLDRVKKLMEKSFSRKK